MRWRFRLTRGSTFGAFASTPLVVGSTVYLQDLSSSVHALDLATGKLRWHYIVQAPNDGPNGLAFAGGRLFGATDTRVFALDARTGRHLWGHKLTNRHEQFVDIAPLAARGLVFTSTVGFAPSGRGALYALDQRTGKLRWRFDTIRDPWPYPVRRRRRRVVSAVARVRRPPLLRDLEPRPVGRLARAPERRHVPGPTPYTDALLSLTAGTGQLLWYDQVTKHDVRDYDLEASPIVVGRSVYGAGKSGRVVAWDRISGKRQWTQTVGTHLHDLGPLPRQPTLVCPGLWGGVLTPMAYAAGRLFVPVVERCMHESSIDPAYPADLREGDGVLYALSARTGRKLWFRRLGAPATGCATVASDVVFAPSLDGRILARCRAGRTHCCGRRARRPASTAARASHGDLLLVGAGAPRRSGSTPELVAYGL